MTWQLHIAFLNFLFYLFSGLATYKANVRFPNKSYDPNMADRNSSVFNKTDVEFCGAVSVMQMKISLYLTDNTHKCELH